MRIRAQAAPDGYALHPILVSTFHRCLQTDAQDATTLYAVPDDAALCAVLDSSVNMPLDTSRDKGYKEGQSHFLKEGADHGEDLVGIISSMAA